MSLLEDENEIEALRLVEQKYDSQDAPASRFFAQLFDCFQHHGPNDIDARLVIEFLGPAVSLKVNAFIDICFLTHENGIVNGGMLLNCSI